MNDLELQRLQDDLAEKQLEIAKKEREYSSLEV